MHRLSFKDTYKAILDDLPNKNKTLKQFIVSYFYSPGFRVLLNHRLGKYFFTRRNFLIRQIGNRFKYKLIAKRSCDISYNSTIGKNLRIPHPIGIVIGDGVIIRDNVMVFQQVTFGSHGKKSKQMAYPVIEDGVTIYAGAKIIGGITIGGNSIIGANAVVTQNIPGNSVAGGIPAKIIKINE